MVQGGLTQPYPQGTASCHYLVGNRVMSMAHNLQLSPRRCIMSSEADNQDEAMTDHTKPRAILFDLYNTLIHIRTDEQDPELWRNLARFLCYQGLPADAATLQRDFAHSIQTMHEHSREQHPEVDLSRIFHDLLHALGYAGPAQFTLEVTRLFRALSMRELALFPDVLPSLHNLKRSFKLGIISDSQRLFLEDEMRLLALPPLFDAVISSYDYGFRKPDPRLFRLALAALDVSADEAIYVGDDSYRDICGAHRAGIRAVWLRRPSRPAAADGHCEPERIVPNLSELTHSLLE